MITWLSIFCAFLGISILVWAFFAVLKRNDDSDDDLGYLENIVFEKGGISDEQDF